MRAPFFYLVLSGLLSGTFMAAVLGVLPARRTDIFRSQRTLERTFSIGPAGVDSPFVYVGPQGYPFPHGAEARFHEAFHKYWDELYGNAA